MKKLLFAIPILALAVTAFLPPSTASADVYVNGYDRSNGTHVNGHYRSDPDGSRDNNWSHSGNTNPYTGAKGNRH